MEAHEAQTITLVLMDKNIYDLSDGSGKCAAVVGMKDCLNELGVMNSTDVSAGGWNACERRMWCNGDFKDAIQSATKNIFKQFKVQTSAGGHTPATIITSDDYFTLAAEKESIGHSGYGTSAEASVLSWVEYYKTTSHRIKRVNKAAAWYWGRSPRPYNEGVNEGGFTGIDNKGNGSYGYAAGEHGLSMQGVI